MSWRSSKATTAARVKGATLAAVKLREATEALWKAVKAGVKGATPAFAAFHCAKRAARSVKPY
jgi:hypothetical protein